MKQESSTVGWWSTIFLFSAKLLEKLCTGHADWVLFGLSTETWWTYGLKTCMCTEVDYIWSRFILSIGMLRQHIKKKKYYFADKGPSSQSYGFSCSHVWMWELGHKEGWAPKNWCFWAVVLEKTLEGLLDCKEIKQFNPKEISPKYSLKGLMLKLKCQYFGHLMWRADSLEKTLMLGKIEGRRRRGMTEDEMVGGASLTQWTWVWAGVDRQRSLVCCSPWGCKESDMTEQLNWLMFTFPCTTAEALWKTQVLLPSLLLKIIENFIQPQRGMK